MFGISIPSFEIFEENHAGPKSSSISNGPFFHRNPFFIAKSTFTILSVISGTNDAAYAKVLESTFQAYFPPLSL